MNFERGKDPLKTMDLGAKQKLEKQLHSIANQIGCFHDNIPKHIDFLFSKNVIITELFHWDGDLAEFHWTNHKGQRRRSRIGYPEFTREVEVVKRKWYGRKYTIKEKIAVGPFSEMVAEIKFSEENLDWESIEII